MKFITKLRDWKFWLFWVIPIPMFIAGVAICIYGYKTSSNDPALFIVAQLLFVFAAILIYAPIICNSFKQKHYIRSITSVIFFLCFICLHISAMITVPKLYNDIQEKNRLYEEYITTPTDDAEYYARRDAWYQAINEESNLSFNLSLMLDIGTVSLGLSSIIIKINNSKTSETEIAR